MSERTQDGRFATGNAGGPGRPRRAVEQDYLARLSDAVTLDDWESIVEVAVNQAMEGDEKARAWLAKYLLGEKPARLIDLAAQEAASISTDDTINKMARRSKTQNKRDDAMLRLEEAVT